MGDNVTFREAPQETTSTEPTKKVDTPQEPKTQSIDVDVPFTAYEATNHHPFSADYFELGDHWMEYEEVPQIEDYLKELVDKGTIANTQEAIKEKMRQIEKMVNIDKTERQVVRIAKIAAYVKFLKEASAIERSNSKYGSA